MKQRLSSELQTLSKSAQTDSGGTLALFSGDTDAEKIQAAESLATDLNKQLIRLDLTQYIGETEKNLRDLFQRAEHEDWVLFFDEADALFGKRTKVKDSHDRYANVETSYLLQRLEAYRGLAILSTNSNTTIDPSWRKKLRQVLGFSNKSRKDSGADS